MNQNKVSWTTLFIPCLAIAAGGCGSSSNSSNTAGAGGSGNGSSTTTSAAGGNTGGSSDGGGTTGSDPTRFSVTGCPEHIAEVFLDVSLAPGAGEAYPLPSLHLSCDDTTVTVTHNGIPHYEFIQMTPMELVNNVRSFQFPLEPKVAAQSTSPLNQNGNPRLGYFGVAVNGIPFYGPTEATQGPKGTVPYGDPVFNGLMDPCLGHGAPHHYHDMNERCLVPEGLVFNPWLNDYKAGEKASPILAFAADGFPVYGSWECTDDSCTELRKMKSGWQLIPNGSLKVEVWKNVEYVPNSEDATVLDECNGHDHGDKGYHYHRTDTFPYIIGCFTGSPVGIMGMGGGMGGG